VPFAKDSGLAPAPPVWKADEMVSLRRRDTTPNPAPPPRRLSTVRRLTCLERVVSMVPLLVMSG